MTEKIVVVGNGIAAITAIKSIREIDQQSEIHVVGEEKFYPYNRIRLSKGLFTTIEEDKILLQKKEWYETNNINLYTNTKVTSIDTDRKIVKLSDGNTLAYTKLLLANGASNVIPSIPGSELNGVYTLRTLQDAWDVIEYLKEAEVAVNIGAGIQGIETAWILSQMGKKVILVGRSPVLMSKQLDKKSSQILEKAVRSCGVEVLLNTNISEITGSNRVQGVKTTEGKSYECDIVTYSMGIQPNTEILEGTPVKVNKGIVVDEKMQTNIKDVYAAGDVAEYNNHLYGLWNISIGHGKTAGCNIAGKDSIYENIIPVTTLSAFNLSLFSMGEVDENKATDIILDDRSEENIYNKVLIQNNKVIGAIVIGQLKYSPVLKTAIEKEINLTGIDFNKVSFDELIQIIKNNK
jgi:nitrite reductase (NADH) large subunit